MRKLPSLCAGEKPDPEKSQPQIVCYMDLRAILTLRIQEGSGVLMPNNDDDDDK